MDNLVDSDSTKKIQTVRAGRCNGSMQSREPVVIHVSLKLLEQQPILVHRRVFTVWTAMISTCSDKISY